VRQTSSLLQKIYSPETGPEKNLLFNLKKTIDETTKSLTPLKRRQVRKILRSTDSSPQSYIKAFSPINLVQGNPGGGFSHKNKKLILHPSWAKHPSSFLLAIHEFEHILYFTDTYFQGDRHLKIFYHFLMHPKSFIKRIEEKAIKRTGAFVRRNYDFNYCKKLEKTLQLFPDRQTINILRRNKILDSQERVNPGRVFSITDDSVINAYRSWEKTIYNRRYLSMIKTALSMNPYAYLRNELKNYRSPALRSVKEYCLKIIFWIFSISALFILSFK